MHLIIRKNVSFFAGVAVLIALGGGLTTFATRLKDDFRNDQKMLEKSILKLQKLNSFNPSITQENLQKAEGNAQLAEAQYQKIIKKLSTPDAIRTLEKGRNAFWTLLKIKEYQETMEDKLQKASSISGENNNLSTGIAHDSIKNFGFSRYLSTSRAGKLKEDYPFLKKIYLQKQIMTYLLERAIETVPESITILEREKLPEEGRTTLFDEMRPVPSSFSQNKALQTMQFRIGFTGHTQNLRSFLLEIEKSPFPFVIKDITVGKHFTSPYAIGGPPIPNTPPIEIKSSEKKPIVRDNLSSFIIALEYIIPEHIQKN